MSSATVFRSPETGGKFGPCALAIGNFDGVHIGHQVLLRETVEFAVQGGLHPAALTFHPHPTVVVAPERVPPMICTLDERIRLLEAAGITRILVLPFTPQLAHLSPEDFVRQILVDQLDTKAVFVGENFRFGYRQAGKPATLQSLGDEIGFTCRFVKPVSWRGEVVSSSAIRQALTNGNVTKAGRLLGRCFSVAGSIVSGQGIGSKQTVPTLNIVPTGEQLIPRGVFVTETVEPATGKRWQSITNAGVRPTFGGTELTVETFLLEPLDGPTPAAIDVLFRRYLRAERQFSDSDALKAQIMKDVARAKAYWRHTAHLGAWEASIY